MNKFRVASGVISAALLFISTHKLGAQTKAGAKGKAPAAAAKSVPKASAAPAVTAVVTPFREAHEPRPAQLMIPAAAGHFDSQLNSSPGRLIDETGSVFVEYVLDREKSGAYDYVHVKTARGESMYVDMLNKKTILNPKLEFHSAFSNGLAIFHPATASQIEREKCGYADEEGQVRLAVKYYDCTPFEDGVAMVSKRLGVGMLAETKWGLIDTNGAELVPFVAETIVPLGAGRYAIQAFRAESQNSFIFDASQGKRLPAPGIDNVFSVRTTGALMTASIEGLGIVYFVPAGGSPIEVPQRPGYQVLGANFASFDSSAKTLTIWTQDGREVAKVPATAVKGSYGGVLPVIRPNGKVGLLNERGEWLLSEENAISGFEYGWALAQRDGRLRIIDTKGRTVVDIGQTNSQLYGRFAQAATYGGPAVFNTKVWNQQGKLIYTDAYKK